MSKQILIVDEPKVLSFWSSFVDPIFDSTLYGTGSSAFKDEESIPDNAIQVWSGCEEAVNAILSMGLSDSIVLINAHCRFSGNSLSALEGLRVVELLRMEMDFHFPILVYGWSSLEFLSYRAEYGRWNHLVASFASLETTDDSTHTAFSRLPAKPSLLLQGARNLMSVFGPNSERPRLELARTLIEDEQERLCRAIRHKYHNVLAAHRLLLGAFLAGDISHDTLQATASTIGNKEQKPLNELDELHAKWTRVEEEIALGEQQKIPPPSFKVPTGSVLVIDDHFESLDVSDGLNLVGDAGWRPVYEALLNNRRFGFDVVGFTSYDTALQAFADGQLINYQLILLDLDLGSAEKSGLRLLQEIRSRDPFVPVLIMTSFDDAEVCQLSLELQADGFFAKQLRDKTNISSKGYYQKFIEVLQTILEASTEDRTLFNAFFQKIEFIRSNDESARLNGHCARLEDGVLGELTKFFLLLRTIDRHHLTRHLLCGSPLKAPDQSLDELIIILLDAVTAWLNWGRPKAAKKIDKLGDWMKEQITYCEFWLNKDGMILETEWEVSASSYFGYSVDEVKGEPLAFLFSQPGSSPSLGNLVGSWQNDVWLLKKDLSTFLASTVVRRRGRRRFTVQVRKPTSQWAADQVFIEQTRSWTTLRHGTIQNVTLSDVRRLATEFLLQLQSSAPSNVKTKTARYSPTNAKADNRVSALIQRARNREMSLQRTHSVRSKMGAEAVLLGTYLSNSRAAARNQQEFLDIYEALGPELDATDVLAEIERECEGGGLHLPVRGQNTQEPVSLALIDDHGKENGWAYVCQLVRNDLTVRNIEFLGAEPPESFEDYLLKLLGDTTSSVDVLLLDLRMPRQRGASPELDTGLAVADIIKKWDPLIPTLVLSARSDSITMRKAVYLGATDFFPKEIPGSQTTEDLIDYAARFIHLTEKLESNDEIWRTFRTNCREALRELESTLQGLSSSLTPALPSFLTRTIDTPSLQTELPNWLSVAGGYTLLDLQRQVLAQITFLLRRAIYFVFMHREPYLHKWLDYFGSAIPSLRSELLGYDQVWLNCAMISELLLNVTAISKCGSQDSAPPLSRKPSEAECVEKYLGASTYALALKIWKDRNSRRYAEFRNPTLEESEASKTIGDCLELLSRLGFLQSQLVAPTQTADDILENLRKNIGETPLRVKLELQLSDIVKTIGKLERGSVSNELEAKQLTKRLDELRQQENKTREELESKSVKAVMNGRHELLYHLRQDN